MASNDDDIPLYLMPVAAVLGTYTFVAFMRTFYTLIFRSKSADRRSQQRSTSSNGKDGSSTNLAQLVASWVASAIAYSFVVAKIERAYAAVEYSHFDPYEILGIQETTNTTVIKQAYRSLAKIHHPDKSDGTLFLKLSKAYDALTDETGKRNYMQFGHPDGPLSTAAFQMALPSWLLFPDDRIAIVMLVVYMIMLLGTMFYIIQQLALKLPDEPEKKISLLDQMNSVSLEDLSYLAKTLKPNSTHMEIIMTIITSPENIEWSMQDLERVDQARIKRLEQDKRAPKAADAFDDLFNDEGGWDEDDDDNDAAKAAKKAEQERKKEADQLNKATGKAVTLLEGLDDGVLGQKWVEKTLGEKGVWPPNLDSLKGRTFEHNGQELAALDHPGARRVLCMTVGRLNSMMLNTHPQLLEAGSKKMIDETYFKASMEFRQRVGMLLEASLRVGMAMRSQRLVGTIVEAVAMFKIGVKQDAVPWFNGMMTRQYGILPRLKILAQSISTPDEAEIATGDKAEVVLELERIHAENFTKQKVEMLKKQGIPPQVGLQSYREGWWIMLRTKRMDGETPTNPINTKEGFLKDMNIDATTLATFEKEDNDYKLLTAWPMIIQHVAQQKGKIKVQFKAPAEAGKYKYFVNIKSQDFLGADQELEFTVDVVDASTVKRTPKEETKEKEPKKDK